MSYFLNEDEAFFKATNYFLVRKVGSKAPEEITITCYQLLNDFKDVEFIAAAYPTQSGSQVKFGHGMAAPGDTELDAINSCMVKIDNMSLSEIRRHKWGDTGFE